MELIAADCYHVISIHAFEYGDAIHAYGPESREALNAVSMETEIFAEPATAIKQLPHRTLLSYSPDHGQHLTEGGAGSHGSSNCTQLTWHDTFFCAVFPPGHCLTAKLRRICRRSVPKA